MKRKAQVMIHINWIFVLIVGGIILLFFSTIILRQKTVSESKTNLAVKENLDSIFTSSLVSSGTSNIINLPLSDIAFDCDSYFVGEFDVGVSESLGRSRIIFAPTELSARQLVTWSMEWNLPYKITNLLYITDPKIKYYFVYDGSSDMESFVSEVMDVMPSQMNKEGPMTTGEIASLTYKNEPSVRFIFFGEDPNDVSLDNSFNQLGGKLTALKIMPSDGFDSGYITFYRFMNRGFIIPESPVKYFDFNQESVIEKKYPSLYGAIFSDDYEFYTCMMSKAFARHAFISEIYARRVAYLSGSQEMADRGCDVLYPGPQTALESLVQAAKNCQENYASCTIGPLAGEIESRNSILQDKSCAVIY